MSRRSAVLVSETRSFTPKIQPKPHSPITSSKLAMHHPDQSSGLDSADSAVRRPSPPRAVAPITVHQNGNAMMGTDLDHPAALHGLNGQGSQPQGQAGHAATTTAAGPVRDCAGCGKSIRDRYMLQALDLFWHEDCLKCGCCDCRLGEVGSTLYTRANLVLCKRDYLRLFGTTGYCAACSKVIPAFEMVMRAKSNVYHLECFACQQCNHRFCVGDRFYLCDNKILCEYDYEERLVFANMTYNPSSLAHIRRQVSDLQQPGEGMFPTAAATLGPTANAINANFSHAHAGPGPRAPFNAGQSRYMTPIVPRPGPVSTQQQPSQPLGPTNMAPPLTASHLNEPAPHQGSDSSFHGHHRSGQTHGPAVHAVKHGSPVDDASSSGYGSPDSDMFDG